MTQNDNVLRGDKLVVDMTTGVSRVEVAAAGCNALIKNNQLAGRTAPGTAARCAPNDCAAKIGQRGARPADGLWRLEPLSRPIGPPFSPSKGRFVLRRPGGSMRIVKPGRAVRLIAKRDCLARAWWIS